MLVKKYVALVLQLFIWSSFTLAEWLSGKDEFIYNAILFLVFTYLAFLVARIVIKSNKGTLLVTITSLTTYGALHLLLHFIFP